MPFFGTVGDVYSMAFKYQAFRLKRYWKTFLKKTYWPNKKELRGYSIAGLFWEVELNLFAALSRGETSMRVDLPHGQKLILQDIIRSGDGSASDYEARVESESGRVVAHWKRTNGRLKIGELPLWVLMDLLFGDYVFAARR